MLEDVTVRVPDLVAEGPWVAGRLEVAGLYGPSRRPITFEVLAVWRVLEGRLLEAGVLVDEAGLLRHLHAAR